MRHKQKKETLDVIVQRMTNDAEGNYLADLIKIAEATQNKESDAQQEVLKNVKWLYGYENEIKEALENIKSMLEKKVFNKEASHVTIISGVVCYCTLLGILDAEFDLAKWNTAFEGTGNKRLQECLEVLKRHCPEKIDVEGFCEARRYIRIWDSAYYW